LLLITIIVNISYSDYDNKGNLYASIASSFYYFYFIPGNYKDYFRIIVHIGIILSISAIAILIKNNEIKNNDINFDYTKKKNINKALNDISLIIWIFTSIVAMKI
jgi:hypothetical protein